MTARFVALSEVAEVKRGTTITQKQARTGSIPVVAGGMDVAYFHDTANRGGNVITISGSGANAGFVNFWEQPIFASDCSTVSSQRDDLDIRYAYYFLKSKQNEINSLRSGAAQPHVYAKDIAVLKIPLLQPAEQRRIVDLLSRAEGIVRLRREAQAKAAELIPALFLDMFGDPASNPNGWPVRLLGELSQVISGVAKGRKLDGSDSIELPYMRVANVKDGYLDLSDIKTIVIKKSEIERLRIEPGDMLMTEGGDPDKLGRGALWRGEIANCVHQNHVFKVRSDRTRLLPEYLQSLAGSAYGKAYFFRVSKKTTGIASINKTQLSSFPVVVPPISLQHQFSAKAEAARAISTQQDTALIAAQATFEALLHQAFAAT